MTETSPFIERAKLLLDHGRTDEAMKQLKNALEHNPEDDEALALFARCQFNLKEIDAAISTLQTAIAIAPHNSYYHYLLGFGYYRKDDNKTALELLNESIRLSPWFAEAYGLMAYVYCDEKDFNKALAKANEGLAIDAENITCLNVRSIAQNKLKMTDDAIETMQTALAQDPDNELTHSTVGWNYLEKGKHKLAAHHFREALRIDPTMHTAKEGLKEALKSKIPPYKWLLQYSFWIHNKGKNARWIIPIGLYLAVKLSSAAFRQSSGMEYIAGIIVGAYLLFVITSWLINPIANFFLLFHKDGKYALDTSEKYTALTVMATLLLGVACIVLSFTLPLAKESDWATALIVAAFAFWGSSVPLGKLEYPLSFNAYGNRNRFLLILAALGLGTALLSFVYLPAATLTGVVFLVLFVIDNWLGVFRK